MTVDLGRVSLRIGQGGLQLSLGEPVERGSKPILVALRRAQLADYREDFDPRSFDTRPARPIIALASFPS